MKRGVIFSIIIIIILLLVIPIVFSQETVFDEEKSYSWLKTASADWNSLSIPEVSLAILAFNNHGDDSSAGVNNLISREDPTFCWPKGGCKVIDSAFATLALERSGKDVNKEIEWLTKRDGALNPALSTGNWLIQIKAPSDGVCKLGYGKNKTKDFKVEGNKIDGKWWIDIEGDLQSGLVKNSVSEKINVDCGALSGAIIISLFYKSGNSIFILEQYSESKATLTVNNGCYGTSLTSGGCDPGSTMYASWALNEMEKEFATRAYLESQIPPSGDLEHAVVGRITKKLLYLDYLRNEQEKTGAWGAGDAYTTAFSVFALATNTDYSDVENSGGDYLKRTVANDGYWNNDVGDTAMALIALHGRDLERASIGVSAFEVPSNVTGMDVEICDNGVDDDGDGKADCFDGDCAGDVSCVEELEKDEVACNYDDVCDFDEDCSCGDCAGEDKCEEDEAEFAEGCTSDSDCEKGEKCIEDTGECKKKFNVMIIIWPLIGLLVVGGGAFFYLKFVRTGVLFKRKPKPRPSFETYIREKPIQPGMRAVQPAKVAKPSKEEDELEKSLKEAEKLLYGKK